MKSRKNFYRKIVFTLLSIMIISFIFINSSLDAATSTVQSVGVREYINSLLENLGVNFQFSEYFVRKSAHFIEYFVLAVSLMLMYEAYFSKQKTALLLTLLTGFIVPCIDETIQLFSNGRSAQFSDVLLDFSAVVTAVCMLSVAILFVNRKRGKTNE